MTAQEQRNHLALFWLKSAHSLVFVVESAAILYILYSGLFNVRGPWLVVAVVLVLAEMAVYVLNGLRCPLTKLAKQWGDPTGDDYIADLFLPAGFARLIPRICGTLAIIGLLVVGLRVVLG
jgi:hypothetical protein